MKLAPLSTATEYNPDPSSGPSQEEISDRARKFWQSAGQPAGADLEFWLAAEIVTLREQSEFMRAARALNARQRHLAIRAS
jgi:hypothetical protein